MRVGEQTTADTAHHLGMPPHEQLKGGLIALGHEALQQLRIRDMGRISPCGDAVEIPDQAV
jgi:hypothetical protein